MTDDLDRMLSGGAKSAFNKTTPIGTTVTGIVRDITVRQATEYGTGAPQFFPSGDPKEQIIVEVQLDAGTYTPEDEDDDGVRAIYVKGWGQQRRAFQEAAKRDGKPGIGDRFTATYKGDGVNKQGGFPPKEFEYRIQPMQASADAQWASAPAQVDAAKVAQLRGFGMPDAQIAAALEVPIEALPPATGSGDDTPF